MCRLLLAAHGARVIAAPLVMAVVLIGFGPAAASAATCGNWTVVPSPSPSPSNNELFGMAVASPGLAWAVGYYEGTAKNQTLIEAWNGSSWVQQPSPSPGGPAGPSYLFGAAATSASDAWAVGEYFPKGRGSRALIEHWNGTTWKQMASPDSGSNSVLLGVAATSASNAWAVGYYSNGTQSSQTLIEHWNGTTWTQVPSPNPGSKFNDVGAVSAISARNAWAVGDYAYFHGPSIVYHTLIEAWNGTAWERVPSPSPGSSTNDLRGVAATSASNVSAVGLYNGTGYQTLALHCS
jgi:hypothetical protein